MQPILSFWMMPTSLKTGRGYPHDGRAYKDSYAHDGHTDMNSYPNDGHADKNPYLYGGKYHINFLDSSYKFQLYF